MTDDELREMINRADVDGDGEERATRCPSPRRAPGSAARAFLAQVSREEFIAGYWAFTSAHTGLLRMLTSWLGNSPMASEYAATLSEVQK